MSFVAVFTALMTSFVLIAPIAMAALLVRGSVPTRGAVAAMATPSGCACGDATCASSRHHALSVAA